MFALTREQTSAVILSSTQLTSGMEILFQKPCNETIGLTGEPMTHLTLLLFLTMFSAT